MEYHASSLRLTFAGLTKTIYIDGDFDREITKYTVIYGVYIRFWPTLHIRGNCITNAGPPTLHIRGNRITNAGPPTLHIRDNCITNAGPPTLHIRDNCITNAGPPTLHIRDNCITNAGPPCMKPWDGGISKSKRCARRPRAWFSSSCKPLWTQRLNSGCVLAYCSK